MAEHAFILPPESRMGPLGDEERAEIVSSSILNSKYESMVENVSAYEVITGKTSAPVQAGGGYTYSADFNTPASAPDEAQSQMQSADQTPYVRPEERAAVYDAEIEEESRRSIGDLADNFLGKSGTRQVMRSTGGSIGREIGKSIGEAVLGKKGRTIGGNIGSAIGRNLFGTLSKK